MTRASVSSALLKECQTTAYRLLDDLERLNAHRVVRDSEENAEAFFELVNRKQLNQLYEPSLLAGTTEPLHTRFRLASMGSTREQANELLELFDEAGTLPPPLWLRLLPVCCSLVLDDVLFPAGVSPELRWIAFNVDIPGGKRGRTVNINSNYSAPAIRVEGSAEHLSSVFYHYVRDPTLPFQKSSVYWGIRFRTNAHLPVGPGYWLDIAASLDNSEAAGIGLQDKVAVSYITPPIAIGAQGPNAEETNALYRWWSGIGESDVLAPSVRVAEYCKTLQHFYPDGRWPTVGVDCLLSPSPLWSPDRRTLAAAATVFWGFEGALNTEQCEALHFLSQLLVVGTAQFINTPQLVSQATARGRTDILHSLPIYYGMAANSLLSLKQEWEQKRSQYPSEDWDPFPVDTDFIQSTLMLLRVETEEELTEAPEHWPKRFMGEWNTETIGAFAEQLVWPYVHQRLRSSRLKTAVDEGGPRMPDVIVPKPFTLPNPGGIYPIILIVLRNSIQHASIYELSGGRAGRATVTVSYAGGKVFVRNDGLPPTHRPQRGLNRDLRPVRRLDPPWPWDIEDVDGMGGATYDETKEMWTTALVRKETDG